MEDRFSITEMVVLRDTMLAGAFDSQQVGEMLQVFLMGHGYGVSPDAARAAASRVEGARCSLEVIQQELEGLALVM
ncbi:MAG TPA: hypothetical protein VMS96_11835 [Terriglobales bacterium]|nr:hypothetical protein [Terriglobales bacterium]